MSFWASFGSAIALALAAAFGSHSFTPVNSTAAEWDMEGVQDPAPVPVNPCESHGIQVLVAGVSRTSTSSMQKLLQDLGYDTTHWLGYMSRHFDFTYLWYSGQVKIPNLRKVFVDSCNGAVLDTMVPSLFDDFRRAYPKAKVILTTREDTSWLGSYENYVAQCWLYHWTRHPLLFFFSHVSRAFRLGPLLRSLGALGRPSGLDLDHLPELSEIYRRSDEVLYGSWQPSFWHVQKRKLYEQHVVSSVPPEQLLVFNASADGVEKILEFLNLTHHEVSYPRLFDKDSISSQGVHSQILPNNLVMIAAATATSVVLFTLCMVLIKCSMTISGHSQDGRLRSGDTQSSTGHPKMWSSMTMGSLLIMACLWQGLATEMDEKVCDEVPDVPKNEMLFIHIPYNFGYTVGVAALFGHKVTSTWSVPEAWRRSEELFGDKGAQVEGSSAVWFHARPSPSVVEKALAANPDAKLWGGVAPELQELSAVTGCPLYFTPPKDWPLELAESYLKGKKVFGIVRNPYERLVAMFRGGYSMYGGFPPHFHKTCDVNGALKWLMQGLVNGSISKYASQCTFIPQVEFFEGPYGIEVAVDNLYFPESLNKMLAYNGLESALVEQNVILQITGCNNVWSGDLDTETKNLVYEYFKADFALLCQRFGYCDFSRDTCLVQVPGMCPDKAFLWNETKRHYEPRP